MVGIKKKSLGLLLFILEKSEALKKEEKWEKTHSKCASLPKSLPGHD